jgi:hypothetical protein
MNKTTKELLQTLRESIVPRERAIEPIDAERVAIAEDSLLNFGDVVAIFGEAGAGKSWLLNTLASSLVSSSSQGEEGSSPAAPSLPLSRLRSVPLDGQLTYHVVDDTHEVREPPHTDLFPRNDGGAIGTSCRYAIKVSYGPRIRVTVSFRTLAELQEEIYGPANLGDLLKSTILQGEDDDDASQVERQAKIAQVLEDMGEVGFRPTVHFRQEVVRLAGKTFVCTGSFQFARRFLHGVIRRGIDAPDAFDLSAPAAVRPSSYIVRAISVELPLGLLGPGGPTLLEVPSSCACPYVAQQIAFAKRQMTVAVIVFDGSRPIGTCLIRRVVTAAFMHGPEAVRAIGCFCRDSSGRHRRAVGFSANIRTIVRTEFGHHSGAFRAPEAYATDEYLNLRLDDFIEFVQGASRARAKLVLDRLLGDPAPAPSKGPLVFWDATWEAIRRKLERFIDSMRADPIYRDDTAKSRAACKKLTDQLVYGLLPVTRVEAYVEEDLSDVLQLAYFRREEVYICFNRIIRAFFLSRVPAIVDDVVRRCVRPTFREETEAIAAGFRNWLFDITGEIEIDLNEELRTLIDPVRERFRKSMWNGYAQTYFKLLEAPEVADRALLESSSKRTRSQPQTDAVSS